MTLKEIGPALVPGTVGNVLYHLYLKRKAKVMSALAEKQMCILNRSKLNKAHFISFRREFRCMTMYTAESVRQQSCLNVKKKKLLQKPVRTQHLVPISETRPY